MTSQIRDFEIDHHAGAASVWQRCEGVGLSSADSYEAIARFLGRNPGLSFVAVDGETVVATILCGHDGRRGLIHHLAVLPGYRRRGLGLALLKKAIAALQQAGIGKCHLLVFRENADGLAFWRRVGAEERTSLALFSMTT
jgi:N-acetylglutamate synthase